jgi:hypothetical protein
MQHRSVDLTTAYPCYRVDEVVRIVSRSEVVTTSHVLRRNIPGHASPTVSFFDSMGEPARNVLALSAMLVDVARLPLQQAVAPFSAASQDARHEPVVPCCG